MKDTNFPEQKASRTRR